MKLTLAEFDAFQKQLPDGCYFEGDDAFVDDAFWDGKYDTSKIIDIIKGDIYILIDIPNKANKNINEDFLTEFKKWKTIIDFEFLTIKIPKGKKDEVMTFLNEKFGELK